MTLTPQTAPQAATAPSARKAAGLPGTAWPAVQPKTCGRCRRCASKFSTLNSTKAWPALVRHRPGHRPLRCGVRPPVGARPPTWRRAWSAPTGCRPVRSAGAALGYYSEREFDFAPFRRRPAPACLSWVAPASASSHRNFAVLNLLWKGIASLCTRAHGARYLLGCSSLTTQDTAVAAAAYCSGCGRPHLAPAGLADPFRCTPFACPLAAAGSAKHRTFRRLLSAYLALGAAICGPPAIDRAFRTIDFLTWLDVQSPRVMAMQTRGRFAT